MGVVRGLDYGVSVIDPCCDQLSVLFVIYMVQIVLRRMSIGF
jgi:hypothetical protein